MTDPRHALLAWAITFVALLLQTGAATDAARGPFHGRFIRDGVGLKKTFAAEAVPLKGDARWTIYCWVGSEAGAPPATLLAGFGEPKAAPGAQRFLATRAGNISFRTGEIEVTTETPLRRGGWQFIAAKFDGETLRLYADGAESVSRGLRLADAAPVIHLAPVPPEGSGAAHFAGRIAALTLVARVLSSEELHALAAREHNLDALPFEAGSKTWPVQLKGQSGLRAPQGAWTLPRDKTRVGRAARRASWSNSRTAAPRSRSRFRRSCATRRAARACCPLTTATTSSR